MVKRFLPSIYWTHSSLNIFPFLWEHLSSILFANLNYTRELLTIITMLCIRPSEIITERLYLCHHFPISTPLVPDNNFSIIFFYSYYSLLSSWVHFLFIPHIIDIMKYVAWFITLSIIPSNIMHVVSNVRILSFSWLNNFHPFICQ